MENGLNCDQKLKSEKITPSRNLENRVFFLVLTLCLLFGAIAATWIIHSEKKRVMQNAKDRVGKICSHYHSKLTHEISEKVMVGLSANTVVQTALKGAPASNLDLKKN